MKKITLSLFFLVAVSFILQAQPDPDQVLMTIAGRDITVGEFDRIYRKNNNDNVSQKQSVEEYLDMFINFKLKVIEAEEQGMDTTASFLKEFNSYKQQLAKPYLTNPEITEKFAKEAYKRMKEEVNASHILISLPENPSPDDTLKAWNKLIEIRSQVNNGEDFEKLARLSSDDPTAKSNGGGLGWFSAFRMVYPFESHAYMTPVGEVSMPFMTQFGMHIMYVHDRRPALGAVRIAHIFIRAPESMTREEQEDARVKAFDILDSLKNGSDFGQMAERYSDDRSSAVNGGEIPWIRSGQMIEVFDKAAFSLENPGQISDAVKSDYGYHIIKLLEKKPIGSYEDEKPGILQKLKTGERASLHQDAFIASLKAEYGYKLNDELLQEAISRVDTTIADGSWDKSAMKDLFGKTLFTCGEMTVKLEEYAEFLTKKQRTTGVTAPWAVAQIYFDRFEKQKILAYEEDNLPNKFPEYKHILQEYHDGILLFDLTDRTIWSKAVEDTTGLEAFYQRNKENYKWEKRAEAWIVTVKDSSLIDDVRKRSAKLIKKKKFSPDKLMEEFCANDTTGQCLEIVYGKYEKGDNSYVDKTEWKKGLGKTYFADGVPKFVALKTILDPEVKALSDTRGQVTADYQKHLEDQWVSELREKYEFDVNMDLLKQIKDQ